MMLERLQARYHLRFFFEIAPLNYAKTLKNLRPSWAGRVSAEVKTENSTKIYIGSTGGTFKTRYNNHKYTLNNKNANSTALSSYVWSQREAGKNCEITWKIIARAGVYAAIL